MQNVPSLIQQATVASSRSPKTRLWACWDRAQSVTEWFRLDQSMLDSNAVLTLVSYNQNETPNETISEADDFIYQEETDNVISAEGTVEYWGDNYQYATSEMDIILANSDGRYTPLDDRNILTNPSFESQLLGWNMAKNGGTYENVGSGANVVSGSSALRFSNPLGNPNTSNYVYSDSYTIHSGASYTGSVFARGVGDLNIRIVGIGSGSNAVSSGIGTFTLASGEFRRFSLNVSLPIEASTARIDFATTNVAIIDCVQLEESNTMTDYEENFIGDLILPRRPTKLHVEMLDTPTGSGGTIPNFVGLTETFEPNIKNDTIHIHCYDFGKELQEKKAITSTSTGPRMFTNKPTEALLIHLADMAGLTSDDYNFERGKNVVPFFWIQDGSIMYYMSMLAEAEGGRIFFDEDGVLNFWNRDHIDNNINSVYQFTNEHDILDYSYRIDKDEIFNHIIVKTSPREVQANQVVWSLEAAEQIQAGQNKTIWCTLDDPLTGATQPTSTGSTSYIRGNTEYDNSGTDISGNLYVSDFTVFATDIKIVVDNQSGKDGYITGLSVFGTPAKITKEIEVEAEDSDSIDTYGRQTLQIENNYILNESYAQNLANDKLFNLKNPRSKAKISVLGVPYLQLGDIVTVPEGYSGQYQNLFIKRKRWEIADGDYIEHLELEQKTIAVFFILDNSRLDGTDVLAE